MKKVLAFVAVFVIALGIVGFIFVEVKANAIAPTAEELVLDYANRKFGKSDDYVVIIGSELKPGSYNYKLLCNGETIVSGWVTPEEESVWTIR